MATTKNRAREERRQTVQRMLFDHTIEEIAKELDVSRATIKRDKAAIVKAAMVRLSNIPKEDILLDYTATIDRVKKRIIKLDTRLLESTEAADISQLSKEIRENEKFLMQLYDGAAAIYLKKKIGDGNV
jgi:predicted DNA-binding transcriptional regulator YafY